LLKRRDQFLGAGIFDIGGVRLKYFFVEYGLNKKK
jgi:hypothetical protein